MTGLYDSFRRPVNYLRISVTDRCNLRCVYCMPESGIKQIPHQDILTYEEIHVIARAATEMGINKVRLTGGEPLVRLGLAGLINMISHVEGIDDISLTTNGTLLGRYAADLKRAGLKRVNVSLDSLRSDRFRYITRSNYDVSDVLRGIDAAFAVGLVPVKINVVVMAGINDDEIIDFARKTIEEGWNVRFIEFMLTAGVAHDPARFVPVAEIKKRLAKMGVLEPVSFHSGNGPARYFRFPGSTGTIGFITPVSEHFCFQCNRLRLTSDGKLRPCLLSDYEIDLKEPLRSGMSSSVLKELIELAVRSKPLRHHITGGRLLKGRPMTQVGG
ncbi:MAG: GTP 3',8-cyclase MoaA [Dehalococcoidales bacterium]